MGKALRLQQAVTKAPVLPAADARRAPQEAAHPAGINFTDD